MTINEFTRELRRSPFRPFTLVTITAAQFVIDHPEFAAIDRRGRVLTFYAGDNTRHEIDTRLIERIIAVDPCARRGIRDPAGLRQLTGPFSQGQQPPPVPGLVGVKPARSSRGVRPSVRRGKVLVFSGCNSHPATGSLQPVAIGAAVEVTKPSEPSRQTGRLAARRADRP